MIRRLRELGYLFMDSKDRYVLNKIYAHIVSVLKYCENANSLEDFN